MCSYMRTFLLKMHTVKTIVILLVGWPWYEANACTLTTTASNEMLGGLRGMMTKL